MTEPPDAVETPQEAQQIWREVAHLRAENAALRAALRQFGQVCRLAGDEMVMLSDVAAQLEQDPPVGPPFV